jgi:hypothetical protein
MSLLYQEGKGNKIAKRNDFGLIIKIRVYSNSFAELIFKTNLDKKFLT